MNYLKNVNQLIIINKGSIALYITKELLYPQRTFISPKNFYITNQLLYHQSNFYITKQFLPKNLQKKQNNKNFCTEFMVIQDNCGPTLLRGLPPGTPSPRKKFESFAYSGSWILGGKNFSREGAQSPLETPQFSWITKFTYTKYNNLKKYN